MEKSLIFQVQQKSNRSKSIRLCSIFIRFHAGWIIGERHLEKESDSDKVIALPRVGGLHHKYVWKKSA